jgi:hypothetical protein
MSITKTLNDKALTDADKLSKVAEVVAGAREAYGNSDVEIPAIKVETPHGRLSFNHLEDDSKVEILRNQALHMKSAAIAYVEAHPGTVLNKKVGELLATNPYFANVDAATEFEYL